MGERFIEDRAKLEAYVSDFLGTEDEEVEDEYYETARSRSEDVLKQFIEFLYPAPTLGEELRGVIEKHWKGWNKKYPVKNAVIDDILEVVKKHKDKEESK